MILVIGSHALNEYEHVRTPADIDVLMTWDTLQSIKDLPTLRIFPNAADHFIGYLDDHRIEISIVRPGTTNEELCQAHIGIPTKTFHGLEVIYCKLDWLYALKMSHRFKKDSPHFLKAMQDIKFMRKLHASIPNKDWFLRRQKETLARHPRLNQSKDSFFDTPGIVYRYDHDSIHKAVALGDKPAYQYYIGDLEEVWCDRTKWDTLDDEIKYNGVLEEALVLALERSQIPFDFQPDKTHSFKMALTKVCTSITSGWFRAWAWEHYDGVLERFNNLPWDYVERFNTKLEAGVVLKLKPEEHNER